MLKQCLAFVLVLFTPTELLPQRYGRPYTLAENPQLLLQIRVGNQSRYFRASDLRKLQRSVVTVTDSTTNTSHVYEGVALEQLVPSPALALEGGSIEIEYDTHKKLQTDFSPQTTLIVIDTVDGKLLSGYAPYYFVEKPRGGPTQTISNVKCITVRSSR